MSLWLMLLAIWLVPAVPTWLAMLLLPLWRYGWPGLGSFTFAVLFSPVIAVCWPGMLLRFLSETIDGEEFRSLWFGDPEPPQLRVVYRVVQVDTDALESIR